MTSGRPRISARNVIGLRSVLTAAANQLTVPHITVSSCQLIAVRFVVTSCRVCGVGVCERTVGDEDEGVRKRDRG